MRLLNVHPQQILVRPPVCKITLFPMAKQVCILLVKMVFGTKYPRVNVMLTDKIIKMRCQFQIYLSNSDLHAAVSKQWNLFAAR